MISTIRIHIGKFWIGAVSLVAVLAAMGGMPVQAAACAPPADYGKASSNITLPSATTYRVWTHMWVPNTTNNTYLLQIDGNSCSTIGGSNLSAGAWQWTASQSNGAKLDIALGSGNHTVDMIGNQPNVKVDRVIFTSDLACLPLNDGSNCNVPNDTTPPTVKLTSPAANANIQGTLQITATASDNVGVTKVEFYVNSILISTSTASPYSAQWDSTKTPNGVQLLVVRAYDAAGNVSADSYSVNVQNQDSTPPSTPTNLTATSPAYNKVQLTWQASTDNIGVKGYTIIRDGVPLVTLGAVTSYSDTQVLANTGYSYQVQAFDAAGNTSASSAAVSVQTATVADSQPPSQPTGLTATAISQTQINLSWQTSTDNTGVTNYDIYRASQKIASVAGTVTSYGDTNLTPSTAYTYYIVARDGAGNSSSNSATASATTLANTAQKGVITGTIRANDTNSGISRSWVYVRSSGGKKYIYQADHSGKYTIPNLTAGTYTLLYQARGYVSQSFSIKVAAGDIITKDVSLQKR